LARDNQSFVETIEYGDAPLPMEFDGTQEIEPEVKEAAASPGDYSLESILAEYKGTAYIAGDKRTPSSVLQEKTEKIVMEVSGGTIGQTHTSAEAADKSAKESTAKLPSADDITKAQSRVYRAEREHDDTLTAASPKAEQPEVIPFQMVRDKAKNTRDDWAEKDIQNEVNAAIERETQYEEEGRKSARKFFGLFSRNSEADDDDAVFEDDAETPERTIPVVEEEVYEEPDFRDATKRFAERCNSYSVRSFVSLVITVVMAILTLVFESGADLPFGIGSNKIVFAGILLIFLFIVMMLSIDKLLTGIRGFFKGGPGVESLNFLSCLATAVAAAYSIYRQDTVTGMPYCVISAFSLTFTLWAEKIYYRALTETMKTAQAAAAPSGVIAEMCAELESTIIKKVSGRTSGFYNNLIQADIGEIAYKYAAPILMIASAVLAFYASVGHGKPMYFLHHFAAIMAAAAPFSAIFAYAVPFSAVSRRARQSGAAVAGWGGADDLFHTDGVSITDEDLFPAGTVSVAGVKIFEEVSPEKAIRYTGSLIIASNSGLAKLFSEQLNKQAISLMRVEDFACYEGGIGGVIKGERVIVGSAAFMNLMGIRVPSSLNMKNAIFTAVNKKLIAVFAINYVPIKSVQNALISVLKYRVKLFFAVRDFNITPVMLEQKFKVPVNDVEYIPIQNTYELSDDAKQEAKRVSAILIREGMGPYVESITGGRRLRTTALYATVFSILSACAGMLIMFTICWAGSFGAASAGNLLLYMLSMLFVTLIICGFAKYRQ
jgi:cation transport ATPase